MMPSLRTSATIAQTDTWRKDHLLRLHHACIAHVGEMVNKFGSKDKYLLCADDQVYTSIYLYIYKYIPVYTFTYSLSMDGAEVAINCLCSAWSCATCWCPDSELADGYRGECHYQRMAEVMEQLNAARDELLDDDDRLQVVGRVKDVKEVEKRLRHKCLPQNTWRLVPFFELFMSAPKDELHQWYEVCTYLYVLVCTSINYS